jgi:type II restriction enzyme
MRELVNKITAQLNSLSPGQLALLASIVDTFTSPTESFRKSNSDFVSQDFLVAFGDVLKLHHTMSDDYLDKHRFEASVERVCRVLGIPASRPSRNNPGHDITVSGVPWSLKTQGDSNIKVDTLHISKFMELGKGKWETVEDLHGLRDQFLMHMKSYKRIFQLRYFRLSPSDTGLVHSYELVEIPIHLLNKAKNGIIHMVMSSKQLPKPGYCTVVDKQQNTLFRLYFDGGTERKLQIKDLLNMPCLLN